MAVTSRPTMLSFDTPVGPRPFNAALLWYSTALGLSYENTADVLANDEVLGLVNRRTVWRWTREAGDRWWQVPDLLKQRRIITRLRTRHTRRQRG